MYIYIYIKYMYIYIYLKYIYIYIKEMIFRILNISLFDVSVFSAVQELPNPRI